MTRPDMYIAQLTAQAAWLRTQGDHEGADLADSLVEHIRVNHDADDVATTEWVGRPGNVLDTEPDIRCWPNVGCVFAGDDGPYLTIDPMDGSDVSIVHIGDVVRWSENRGAPALTMPTTISGEIVDAVGVSDAESAFQAREDEHRDYHARLLASVSDAQEEPSRSSTPSPLQPRKT